MVCLDTIEIKDVSFVCECGSKNNITILIDNSYGFYSNYCENCGQRYILEYDDGNVNLKLK